MKNACKWASCFIPGLDVSADVLVFKRKMSGHTGPERTNKLRGSTEIYVREVEAMGTGDKVIPIGL